MGVVLGLIAATIGLGLASNFRGVADQFADFGASRPRPPSWMRGYTRNAGTIRLIGGVFLVFGVFAIGAAIQGMLR
jgi:hypothetical protein